MFKRMLVPIDLSQKSLAAVDRAFELAVHFGSEVILMHVIETIEHVEFDELKEFYRRLETDAKKQMNELSARFIERKLNIDEALVYGHRTREIVDYATARHVDLIVMSSHRIDPEHAAHDWTSISYAVAILSPCPVL